jgi:RsiW-degrading membrane proteinase PrsW (M82 family)
LHTLSLAAGGALAYGIHAFWETPVAGGNGALARVGNAVFLAAATALICAGVIRTSSFTKRHATTLAPQI